MIELRRQEALLRVQREQVLHEVYVLEPRALETVIEQALAHPPDENRWQAYEDLKAQASQIVGWDARHIPLTTVTHYEVMVAFIDWLLPRQDEQDEEDGEEDER